MKAPALDDEPAGQAIHDDELTLKNSPLGQSDSGNVVGAAVGESFKVEPIQKRLLITNIN